MLYVIIIGLSAFLLFQVQPMISKIILPTFGGGASIWLTCITFFQLLLLAGYASSHYLIEKLGTKKHLVIQACLVAAALVFLPLQAQFDVLERVSLPPSFAIFLLLLVSVGLPYFVLSTTSPTVQHWIASDQRSQDRNPYIQYAVSNAGSLAGLLTYPFWVEPIYSNSQQTSFWSVSFLVYAALMLLCMAFLYRNLKPLEKLEGDEEIDEEVEFTRSERFRWLYLAAIPSAALLVVTHYLTVDIVSFPLLWVLPLSLYLISFIVCFAFPQVSQPSRLRTVITLIPITALIPTMLMIFMLREAVNFPVWFQVAAACLCLFAICMFFHGELERDKPAPRHLTKFYTYLSLGGCLGSMAISLVSPVLFNSSFEFYLVLFGSFYLIAIPFFEKTRPLFKKGFQGAMILVLVVTFVVVETTWHQPVSFMTYKDRSFYNTYVIIDIPEDLNKHWAVRLLLRSSIVERDDVTNKMSDVRFLVQGTTIHGGQARNEKGELMPVTYFHEDTGVGQVLLKKKGVQRVAVVGLGTGVLAVYAQKGQKWDLYEIDQMVVDIAEKRFDNLKECKGEYECIVGDGRLEIKKKKDQTYDVVIMDAFTSDAVPTHLITKEAVEDILKVLKPGGVICYNISNHYVDLWPVLNGIAHKLDLQIRYHSSIQDAPRQKFSADWVILTRDEESLSEVIEDNRDFKIKNDKKIYWTDDFSDIWSILRF